MELSLRRWMATHAALLGGVSRSVLAKAACRRHNWKHFLFFYGGYRCTLVHCCLSFLQHALRAGL